MNYKCTKTKMCTKPRYSSYEKGTHSKKQNMLIFNYFLAIIKYRRNPLMPKTIISMKIKKSQWNKSNKPQTQRNVFKEKQGYSIFTYLFVTLNSLHLGNKNKLNFYWIKYEYMISWRCIYMRINLTSSFKNM